jgi:hypothetical protein
MPIATVPRTRQLTVIAEDPELRYTTGPKKGRIVTARITIPAERLDPGPRGYRVHCIDYDSTNDTYYDTAISETEDQFEKASDDELLGNPNFHCQNAYALVMFTLARFEYALGRRLGWSFKGHQLKLAPHAFSDSNAFYSEEDRSLFLGYFPSADGERTIFTCLSHDVIVHETTHALVDGLRSRYTDPSSPDQAAFHEGFADVVALLSIFSLPEIAEFMIDRFQTGDAQMIAAKAVTPEALREAFGGLAREVGQEISGVRGQPLRQSLTLVPDKTYLQQDEFQEPHRRGEILVAAMVNAFLEMWSNRLKRLGEVKKGFVDRVKVIEEGADLAETLLTSAIRALDYTPPVDLSFGDYVSALVTADSEVRPRSDDRYELRKHVLASFRAYGIEPASNCGECGVPGCGLWAPAPEGLDYGRVHYDPMKSDADEIFHFIWENRTSDHLNLHDEGYTDVQSVRPCIRIGADGFTLRETVAEYVQVTKIRPADLADLGLERPEGMPDDLEFYIYGGGALIFDEYGRLKYHIFNPLRGSQQNKRIDYLWRNGGFSGKSLRLRFSALHRTRAAQEEEQIEEAW